MQSLRQEIDEKFNGRNFVWSNVRPNDAAGLLKLFLRDLPAPMLTYEYIDAFAQVERKYHGNVDAKYIIWYIL